MNKYIALLILIFTGYYNSYSQVVTFPRASESTIQLARAFSKDIFELNGIPYLQPLVQSMNATSNSRFFSSAYVPAKADKPYFKISLNGMYGIIPDNKKSYVPQLPGADLDIVELSKYVTLDLLNTTNPIKSINDTAGLMAYALKVYARRAGQTGIIDIPKTAPTILGSGSQAMFIHKAQFDSLVKAYPNLGTKSLYSFLSDSMKAQLSRTISQFPELYTLPVGSDIQYLKAFVPQLEIGSIYGTEFLIRFIPPLYYGSTIGHFAFWGLGIKHSISQYFPERWFGLALQGVYQGTYLQNEVGVTKANLKSNASIFNINLQASKHIENIADIYTAISYEILNIKNNYDYYISVETQWQLGLLEKVQIGTNSDGSPLYQIMGPEPEKGFPGDTVQQHTSLTLNDRNVKWIIGLSREFGNFSVFLDFCISKFNIFTGGIAYRF